MGSLLLAVIYLAFISLGLPDSLLGTAWPVLHADLGAPVAAQSLVSIIISCCTIGSSLLTARLVAKFGTGKLAFASVSLTAIAILGFSSTNALWQLCLIAIPYGLGAGAIDASLNNYVAINYGARHMSWLHCCWGIGASISPVVMGWALTRPSSWHGGYVAVGCIQAVIAALMLLSLPMWSQTSSSEGVGDDGGTRETARGIGAVARIPGVIASVSSFGFYCAFESAIGLWATSYLVMARGFDIGTAASLVSLYYIGMTIGRIASGFLAQAVRGQSQIRTGQCLTAIGIVALFLGGTPLMAGTSLLLIGLGCAPIYPMSVSLTPDRYGEEVSQDVVSLQIACAYTGTILAPPLFGIATGAGAAGLIPLFLAILLAGNVVGTERALQAAGR